jgi:signal peptidase I
LETQHVHEDRDGSPGDGQQPSRSSAVRGRLPRWARDLAVLVVVCGLVLVLVNRFVVQPFGIPSDSMEPLLKTGDRVLVNRLAYAFGGAPRRGDVVVFDGLGSFKEDGAAEDFVKRVVGVGGDRVVCCDASGRITVNGVALDESSYLYSGEKPSDFGFDAVVPPGKLFVLGDHRAVSKDSRDHLGDPGGGMVPVSKVVGRVDWVILPVGHWRSVDRPAAFAALESGLGGKGGTHGHQG